MKIAARQFVRAVCLGLASAALALGSGTAGGK